MSSIGHSFEAMYGRKAILPADMEHYGVPKVTDDHHLQLKEYQEKIKIMQARACDAYKNTQGKTKERFDKSAKEKTFHTGDKVLLKIFEAK